MPRRCPAGHASTEPDYCSVCGAPLPAQPAPPPSLAPAPPARPAPGVNAHLSCPLCGEERPPASPPRSAAASCAVCCFDFDLPPLDLSPPAAAQPPATTTTPTPTPPTPLPPAPYTVPRWLVVAIDPTLDDEPDPALPCPANQPPTEHPLQGSELLIGRHDPQRPPQVSVHDPGASRRHARLLIEGSELWIIDLGSTNGTRLNGVELKPDEKTPLRPDDAITLGRWTRLTLR